MDREAWGAAVPGVTKSQTELIRWSYYFLCKQMRKVSIAKSKNLRPLYFDNHILVKASRTHCRIWAVTWLCSETIWMCHLQGICFWGSWRFVFLQSSYSKHDKACGCYVFSILPRPDLLVWKNTHTVVILSLVFEFLFTYPLYCLHTLSAGICTRSDGAAVGSSALAICSSGVSCRCQPAPWGAGFALLNSEMRRLLPEPCTWNKALIPLTWEWS